VVVIELALIRLSDARPRLQSLPPLNLLGIGDRQRGSPMYQYHTITMICISQQSNLFTSIPRLDQGYKACPFICQALYTCMLRYIYIYIQSYHIKTVIHNTQQSNLFTSILRLDWHCKDLLSIICHALEVNTEGYPHNHINIKPQIWSVPHNNQTYL